MRTVRLLVFFVLLGLAPVLASGSTVQVNLIGLTFQTASGPDMGTNITHINEGDTVEWVWMGSNHSVTSDTLVSGTPLFDTGVQKMPFSFSYTFASAGTYPYHCSVHGACCGMVGTIIVNGSVSGAVSLVGCVNLAQTLTFQFRPASGPSFSASVALAADGSYSVPGIPAGVYDVAIVGSKWLQTVVSNVVVVTDLANVNATLLPGDLNGDNVVDINDFGIFATQFGLSGDDLVADLNCDGVVDITDFGLFASDFGLAGDP